MNPLQPDELRLLAETGFLAGARGDLKNARTIFDAVQLCRPDAASSYAGMAIALLNTRRHDEALAKLDEGLRLCRPSDQADLHAMRALALKMAGRASESARAAAAAGNHPLALALSQAASPLPTPVVNL